MQIQLSEPHSLRLNETVEAAGEKLTVHSMNTGVPHAVVFVSELDAVDMRKLGAALRYHPHFAPKGTNANFVEQLDPQTIAIRTYERGRGRRNAGMRHRDGGVRADLP